MFSLSYLIYTGLSRILCSFTWFKLFLSKDSLQQERSKQVFSRRSRASPQSVTCAHTQPVARVAGLFAFVNVLPFLSRSPVNDAHACRSVSPDFTLDVRKISYAPLVHCPEVSTRRSSSWMSSHPSLSVMQYHTHRGSCSCNPTASPLTSTSDSTLLKVEFMKAEIHSAKGDFDSSRG